MVYRKQFNDNTEEALLREPQIGTSSGAQFFDPKNPANTTDPVIPGEKPVDLGIQNPVDLGIQNNRPTYTPEDYTSNPLTYENAPSYANKYREQIEALKNSIMNRGAFSYNPANDPLYQQYADSYTRGGQRAMQDTLGQMAARTGGLASSYAGSAAQQSYNNYMAGLADKVPELYKLAYSMYSDEGDRQMQQLNMLNNMENQDYSRYQDEMSQLKADAQAKAKLLAAAGDYSGYKALGYSDAEIKTMQDAAKATGGSGDGSASYKSVLTKAKGFDNGNDAKSYLERMVDGGYITEAEAAYIYLVELGYTAQALPGHTGALADGYKPIK